MIELSLIIIVWQLTSMVSWPIGQMILRLPAEFDCGERGTETMIEVGAG